jgi:peptidoglycan/LPS O-acetylase OafA/YrhL
MKSPNISHDNNFNLLRLLAAMQVLVGHVSTHLHIDIGPLGSIIAQFPGVPIFFTISGFLIMSSFDRDKNIKRFFVKRILRIYPALWICFIFTFITLLFFKGISINQLKSRTILFWVFCQNTIFQYYTPDILRGWGVSTTNGSLWTIPVELEFYALIPLLFFFLKNVSIELKLLLLFIISYSINMLISPFIDSVNETILIKLIKVSVFPHLFNFICGCAMYHKWDKIKGTIEDKGIFWLLLYCSYFIIVSFILRLYNRSYYPNILGLIATILLSITTISLAYTYKTISNKILKDIDISYGIYIYHGPIINIFLALNVSDKFLSYGGHIVNNMMVFLIFLIITFFLAYISWIFVEKPALSLKNRIRF